MLRLAVALLFALNLSPLAIAAEPPSLDAFVADPAVSHLAMAPDGHAAAYLRNDGTRKVLNLLPRGAGAPMVVGLKDINLEAVDWIDSTRLGLTNRVFSAETAITPAQYVRELISYDTVK